MIQNQQDKTQSIEQWALDKARAQYFNPPIDPDSIQLQPLEAAAFNGLLDDIESLAATYQSMADSHWSNSKGLAIFPNYTKEQSKAAHGIYANKAHDMRNLVVKWTIDKS